MIQITDLRKSYNSRVVLDIDHLTIGHGETFGLVGNNGAGKTTLFSLLLDLRMADRGLVEIEGTDVRSSDNWKKFTGSYLDETFLIPFLTPREFFSFAGQLHQYTDADVAKQLERFEEFLGSEILGEQRFIRNLSKGNQKKSGIVAAMLIRPTLLVLDEPFSSLDPTSQFRLKNILKQENQQHGTSILISSHDLNHVTEVCSRIAVLESGNIRKDLQTDDNTLRELESYFAVL